MEQAGGTVLRVHLDEAWLHDPVRRFPVRIDPAVLDAGASGDSWVNSAYPTSGNSTDTILKTGGGCSPSNANCQSITRRTYYTRWNLGLLSTATIIDASYATLNVYSFSCQPRWFGVYRITEDWDPAAVTYNNQPNYSHAVLGAFNESHGHEGVGCADAWMYAPMRDLVQDWVDGDAPSFGITGRVAEWDDYTDEYTYKHFASKEAGGNGGQVLQIVWSPYRAGYAYQGGVAPRANAAGWMDIQVTNKSLLNWNAGGANPFKLGYHVYYSDGTTLIPNGWEGHRTSLQGDIGFNGTQRIRAQVNALPPGDYVVKWDMIQEGVKWFSQEGIHPDLNPYEVAVHIPNHPPEIQLAQPGGPVDTRTPTLKVEGTNPDNFPAGATLQYWFNVCEDVGMTVCVRRSWAAETTWTPTHLKWGKTYYWNASVREVGGTTTHPLWKIPLTPTVTQPKTERHFGSDPYAPLHGGVNPSVGNYVASFTDAQVASAGLPAEITRTYNSLDTRTGAFGPGWSTSLDLSLQIEAIGTVLVSFPDGRRERYAKNADGTWAGGLGNQSVLTDTAGGKELKRPDQLTYVFDTQGRPTEIRDGWGHTVTFTRTNGVVTKITSDPSGPLAGSPAGRSLTLTWGPQGPGSAQVITKVVTQPVTSDGQAPQALEWTYSYTGGRLTQVCAPQAAPNCTTYDYHASGQPGAGQLKTLTKPQGNVPIRLGYETNGTVAWVENGVNDRWSFADGDDAAEGTYHPIDGWAAASMTVPANGTITADVTGGGGVPDGGVQAVVVDISANRPAAGGWFAVYPSGSAEPQPGVSTMDYQAGDPRSTMHTVAVGADGKIALTNHASASANVKFDVVGWYAKTGVPGGSVFMPLPTKRILDTRQSGQGPAIGSGQARAVQITGVGGVPTSGVTAVVFDLESINPTADTSLLAYPSGTARPPISTLTSISNRVTDNMQVAKVGADGKVILWNMAGSVDVAVDIVGYFGDPDIYEGNVFRPVTNTRIVDTLWTNVQYSSAWPPGGKRPVVVAGQGPVPEEGVTGFVGDVQALWPAETNPMLTTPSGSTADGTTYIGPKGTTLGNHIYAGLGDNGAFDLTSHYVPAEVAVDVFGYFTPVPRTVTATDPAGNNVEYRYDSLGRMTGRIDQDGFALSHGYNDDGQLGVTIDETGSSHWYGYDDDSHLITDNAAQMGPNLSVLWSATTHYGYIDDTANPARDGKLAWVGDPRSANRDDTTYRTTYNYDSLGQPTSVLGPNGAGVTRTHTTSSTPAVGGGTAPPLGLPATVTDAAGLVTTNRYDSHGDLRRIEHPGGRAEEFTYDQLGRAVTHIEISATYPAGVTTTRVYDGVNRVTKETGPLVPNPLSGNHQARLTSTYTANGQPKKTTFGRCRHGAGHPVGGVHLRQRRPPHRDQGPNQPDHFPDV